MCFRSMFLALAMVLVAACGSDRDGAEPKEGSTGSVFAGEKEAPPSTAFGKTSGSCKVKPGEACIDGFIGHGQRLMVSRLDEGDTIEFRDAADLNDRFREAFVEPILAREGLIATDFDITLYPEVTRNSFASGFVGYVQGTNSTSLHKSILRPDGTFSIDRLETGVYTVRVLKEIMLVQSHRSQTGARAEQCLVFEAVKEDVVVDGDDAELRIVHLGAIDRFDFYVRPNRTKCSSRSALPPAPIRVPAPEAPAEVGETGDGA